MLSTLARGCSSWTGEVNIGAGSQNAAGEKVVKVRPPEHHKHGVTVTPRTWSSRTSNRGHSAIQPNTVSVDKATGCLGLPKTYLTRKGPLLLFTAPEDTSKKQQPPPTLPKKWKQQKLIDLSLKLGTLERLTLSVLQYGDMNFDRENCSVTDKENRWVLKFLHDLDKNESGASRPMVDRHVQPGEDLRFYLRDLKQRASTRAYGQERCLSSRARSQELREILQQLEDALPLSCSQPPASHADGPQASHDEFFYPYSPVSSESFRTPSSARVLSSRKLAASLKSVNYLGRPSSSDVGEAYKFTSPNVDYGQQSTQAVRGNRIKSATWTGLPRSTEVPNRPRSSHYAGRRQSGGSQRLMTSPDLEGTQQRNLSVPVIEEETGSPVAENEEERHISVHIDSDAGYARASEHLAVGHGKEGETEYDQASVATSVQEEEDIILPSDEEMEEAESKAGTWAEELKETPGARADSATPIHEDMRDLNNAKPLQPQYSGVLQDIEIIQMDDHEQEQHRSEQVVRTDLSDAGSLPRSRNGSSTKKSSFGKCPQSAPSSALSSPMENLGDQVPEEKDLAVYEPVTNENVLEAEGNETKITDCNRQDPQSGFQEDGGSIILVHVTEKEDRQKIYASSVSESVDRPEVEPETLVSLHADGTQSKSSIMDDIQTELVPRPASYQSALGNIDELKQKEDGKTSTKKSPNSFDNQPVAMNNVEENSPGSQQASSRGDITIQHADRIAHLSTTVDTETLQVLPPREEQVTLKTPPQLQQPKDTKDFSIRMPALPNNNSNTNNKSSMSSPSASKLQEKPNVIQKAKQDTVLSSPSSISRNPASPLKQTHAKGSKSENRGAQQRSFVKVLDIASSQPNKPGKSEEIQNKEEPKPKKESYRPPPPPPKLKLTEKKDELLIPDHMAEALMRRDSQSEAELEKELQRMKQAIDESLGTSTLIGANTEGLTEEELQQAQQLLRERLEEAQRRMLEAVQPGAQKEKKSMQKEPESIMKKGKKVRMDVGKTEEMAQREERREQQRQERLRRLAAAQALQDLITEKEAERIEKEKEAAKRAKELKEEMEQLRQEEEAIQQAEDDAREQLANLRKIQREEREARRKQDLEKKKQEAIVRREKEKAMMEKAKRKEQEMLDRIADAEMRRALKEEEQRKRDEEERLAQEHFEEELLRAQLEAEEEEKRLQELERQAEEEAFRRIVAEREEAERRREELETKSRKMAEEEEMIRQQLIDEEKRLGEEKCRQEAEEQKRQEEEKNRLKELQALEEQERQKMREALEARREALLKRREVNLDRKSNLYSLQQNQSITPAWIFSYFVHWSRESYMRPMGMPVGGASKKKKKK